MPRERTGEIMGKGTSKIGSLTVAVNNTPQAADDKFSSFEDLLSYLDVLANDAGGAAKSLFSLSDKLSIEDGGTTSAADIVAAGKVMTITTAIGAKASIVVSGANAGTIEYDSSALDSLALGETVVDTFTYVIQLGNGTYSLATVSVTVTGTNDRPTVGAALSGNGVEDGAAFSINMIAGAADVDHGAVLSVANVTGLVPGVTVSGTTLTVDPAHSGFQALKAGEIQTVVVSYNVVDEHGLGVPQTATITITGTNDRPTVAAALTAAGNEGDASFTVDMLAGASDVDHDAVLSVADVTGLVDGVTFSGSTLTVDPTNAAFNALKAGEPLVIVVSYNVVDELGLSVPQTATITITGTNDRPTVAAALTAAGNEGDASFTVDMLAGASDVDHDAVLSVADVTGLVDGVTFSGSTLTVDPTNAAFNALKAGEPLVIVVSYNVVDELGLSVPQTATITITGTNDRPTVAAALTAAGNEGDASFTVDMLAGASDVDHDAVLSVADVTGLVDGVTFSGSTLTVDPTNAAFNALKAGEPLVIVVSYNVVDELGLSVPQTATITITGTNDRPTVAAALTAGAAEDSAAFTINMLTGASDVDHDAVLSVTNVTGLVPGVTFSGSTLTVDPTNAAFQSLTAGEPRVIVVNYNVVDEHGLSVPQSATITITGTADIPTISGQTTGSVTEETVLSATGTLSIVDLDAGQSSFQAQSGIAGTYGSLSITAGGVWTYTLNNSALNVQALNSGQSVIDTVTVRSADGTPQVISITVNGQNEVSAALINAVGALTSQMQLFMSFTDANLDGNQDGFARNAVLDVNANSQEVTYGDFDGDGDIDFVNSSFGDGNVYYFRNNGDANHDGIPEVTKVAIPVGAQNGWSVYATDIDGDGDLDLLVGGNYQTNDQILVNRGDSNHDGVPEFTAMTLPGTIGHSYGMAAGDVNGDGYQDVVLTNFAYGPMQVFYGQGDTNADGLPNFSTVQAPPRPNGSDISAVVADMDGDGDKDIVVTQWGGQRYIDYNMGDTDGDGKPNFVMKTIGVAGNSSFDIKAVDIDGDGDMDLVTTNYGVNAFLYINRGDTNGDSFPDFTTQNIAINSTYSVDFGDWDHDGDADLIFSSASGIHLVENRGVAPGGSINFAIANIATSEQNWSLDVTFVPDLFA
ncbi:MAG: VCBS domain-containing protein [Novosphingobium sp.]